MTALAGAPHSTLHEAESLTDDALRDLLAYPDGLQHPLFRANFIASIDGAVTLEGSGRRLGTPTDRRVFSRLREVADVVLVGATTAKSKPYENLQLEPDAGVACPRTDPAHAVRGTDIDRRTPRLPRVHRAGQVPLVPGI